MIYEHQILMSDEVLSDEAKRYPSDSRLRWRDINPLWERATTQIIANIKIKRAYLRALLEDSLDENCQYIEGRKHFGESEWLYELDPSAEYNETYGKKFLDTTGELDVNITREVVEEFIRDHPEFIGLTRITYSLRFLNNMDVEDYFDKMYPLYQKHQDQIKGFDLVAEEDEGKSLLYFLDTFLKLHDDESSQPKVPLYFHTAETTWPRDLITSAFPDDPVATSQNTFDAILLGSRRLGHGIGYSKHPYLLELIKERDIAVECCPVSSKLLGLAPNTKGHPALTYMRQGIPVVLGSDDAGTFGSDYFTVDWYEVFMGWGLDLKELKQLALNSLLYSSLSPEEKEDAINNKWQPKWDAFIEAVKQEVCQSDLRDNDPVFYSILPKEGAISEPTVVHVFGRNFERAVCQEIRCRFGDSESTRATYVSNHHLMCESPPGLAGEEVYLHVSLHEQVGFLNTGLVFSYQHEPIEPPSDAAQSVGLPPINVTFIKLLCFLYVVCQLLVLSP